MKKLQVLLIQECNQVGPSEKVLNYPKFVRMPIYKMLDFYTAVHDQ